MYGYRLYGDSRVNFLGYIRMEDGVEDAHASGAGSDALQQAAGTLSERIS